jgi:hypothetical protein
VVPLEVEVPVLDLEVVPLVVDPVELVPLVVPPALLVRPPVVVEVIPPVELPDVELDALVEEAVVPPEAVVVVVPLRGVRRCTSDASC